MKNKKLVLIAAAFLCGPLTANATFVFSDVLVTTNSVTFTINGDMSGYAGPEYSVYNDQFSIAYVGDIWVGPTSFDPALVSANTWSRGVFDNEFMILPGNTLASSSSHFYTWSVYGDLSDAYALDQRVTVSFGNFLNPFATTGAINFLWGNGSNDDFNSVIGTVTSWNKTSVPEPGVLGLFSAGLAALVFVRRRRAKASQTRTRSGM